MWNLFAMMRKLQLDHMTELANSRGALMDEIKDSRESFGKVITEVRVSGERQSERNNVVLHELDETVRQLSVGCSAVQTKVLADAEAARLLVWNRAQTERGEVIDRAQTVRTELRSRATDAIGIIHDAEDAAKNVLHSEADHVKQ